MLPTTVARVPNQTADHVNQRIREETEHRVSQLKEAGPAAISRRLDELDAEWDIELHARSQCGDGFPDRFESGGDCGPQVVRVAGRRCRVFAPACVAGSVPAAPRIASARVSNGQRNRLRAPCA